MVKEDFKSIALEVIESNPDAKIVYVTEDSNGFVDKNNASSHMRRKKQDMVSFTREELLGVEEDEFEDVTKEEETKEEETEPKEEESSEVETEVEIEVSKEESKEVAPKKAAAKKVAKNK